MTIMMISVVKKRVFVIEISNFTILTLKWRYFIGKNSLLVTILFQYNIHSNDDNHQFLEK